MNATLLMRLAAPLQSWNAHPRSTRIQPSQVYPTKSGVLGLVANALGRRYDDPTDDLVRLAFGVRLDRRGSLVEDYTVVLDAAMANDKGRKPSHELWRTLIADAAFLAALSGERSLLEQIEQALIRPARVLYLGRRTCVPTPPLCLGVQDLELEQALRSYPWLDKGAAPESLLAVVEGPGEGSLSIQDVPDGPFFNRKFTWRRVRWLSLPPVVQKETEDDPLLLSPAA